MPELLQVRGRCERGDRPPGLHASLESISTHATCSLSEIAPTQGTTVPTVVQERRAHHNNHALFHGGRPLGGLQPDALEQVRLVALAVHSLRRLTVFAFQQWHADTGLPRRKGGNGRRGPRDADTQHNQHRMMGGADMGDILSPLNTPPGSKQYQQMVSDLQQLKAEMEELDARPPVPLGIDSQLFEFMSTPRVRRVPRSLPIMRKESQTCVRFPSGQ